jgi:hypothetical protein
MQNGEGGKSNFFSNEKEVKFISQVPNLTLKPGADAQFDIEVSSSNTR